MMLSWRRAQLLSVVVYNSRRKFITQNPMHAGTGRLTATPEAIHDAICSRVQAEFQQDTTHGRNRPSSTRSSASASSQRHRRPHTGTMLGMGSLKVHTPPNSPPRQFGTNHGEPTQSELDEAEEAKEMHLARMTAQQLLRQSMRYCPVPMVARETLVFLMEQPDTATCPMTVLQEEHSMLLEESLAAVSSAVSDVSLHAGIGDSSIRGGLTAEKRFGRVAASHMDAVDLHQEYARLSEDVLEKDAMIISLQKRIGLLERNSRAVQARLGAMEDMNAESAGSTSGGAAKKETAAMLISNEKEMQAMSELQALNTKLSEHIDTLEHNISMGFLYSDVTAQKALLEAEREREDLKKRNLELAHCFTESNKDREIKVREASEARRRLDDAEHKVSVLERELTALRSELTRVKRHYQDKAMASI